MRISDWSSDVCSSDALPSYRGCTDADQHRVIMSVQAFGGTHVERGVAAQSLADQMRMNGCGGEDHGHAHVVLIDILVREENFRVAFAHCLFRVLTDAGDGRAKLLRSSAGGISAVNLRDSIAEIGL